MAIPAHSSRWDSVYLSRWDLDVFLSMGYGSTTYSAQSSSKPKTTQQMAGMGLSYRFMHPFCFGLLTDYRKISQTTEAVSPWYNRSGSRWNQVSPYLDFFC